MIATAVRPTCDRCHDDLPDDAPPDVRTCRQYADRRARTAGDMLPADQADALLRDPEEQQRVAGLDSSHRCGEHIRSGSLKVNH